MGSSLKRIARSVFPTTRTLLADLYKASIVTKVL
jgi:hypothetical protein